VGLRINNVIDPGDYSRFAEEWDNPGLSKQNYWSYIDARDVGTAYRAALEGTSSGHESASSRRPIPGRSEDCAS
jgi:UDP-glucose 4-epimerase